MTISVVIDDYAHISSNKRFKQTLNYIVNSHRRTKFSKRRQQASAVLKAAPKLALWLLAMMLLAPISGQDRSTTRPA